MIMLFFLIVAIFCSLMWINIVITENINAKINPYLTDNGEEDNKRAKIKIYLIVIIAIFWAIIIFYLR